MFFNLLLGFQLGLWFEAAQHCGGSRRAPAGGHEPRLCTWTGAADATPDVIRPSRWQLDVHMGSSVDKIVDLMNNMGKPIHFLKRSVTR